MDATWHVIPNKFNMPVMFFMHHVFSGNLLGEVHRACYVEMSGTGDTVVNPNSYNYSKDIDINSK